MRLFVDLDTRSFIESPQFQRAVSSLVLKRRDHLPVDVQFFRSGVVVELATGAAGKLGLKADKDFNGPFAASDLQWTKSCTGDATTYRFDLNLNTVQVNALFAGVPTPASVALMLEIEWAEGDLRTSSNTLAVTLDNDIVRGDEGVAEEGGPEYPLPGDIELVANKGAAGGYASLDGTGKVPASQLPPASLDSRVTVADDAARFALTTDAVQEGDYVFQTDTSALYEVTDAANLGNANGYTALATVPWGSVTGKPETYPPSSHSHAVGDIRGLQAALDRKQESGSYEPSRSAAIQAEMEAGTEEAIRSMSPLRVAQAIAALGDPASTDITDSTEAGRAMLTAADAAAQAALLADYLGGGGAETYTLKCSDFTAEAGKSYALDTVAGDIDVTLPASPSEGQTVSFCDARGTWNSHPPTFLRNGNKIESHEVDFTDSAQGTFFCAVFIDPATGWRILESGTKPQNLTLPTISGNWTGAAVTSTTGTWTGSPTSYSYQWQISGDGSPWADIVGATNSTYVPSSADVGKCVRVFVSAMNANGSSIPVASASGEAIIVPPFPAGAVAFWKLDDLMDATGNGHTLTNNGAITFGPGKTGGCALIHGDTDGGKYLASSVSGANTDTGFSISMWIKGTVGGVATSVLQACSSDHQGWFIGSDTSNTLAFLFGDGGWTIAEAFGSYIVGTWRHIVMTADPATADSPKINVYLDGELVKVWDLVAWANAPIELGHFAFNYGSSDYGWAGDMDSVGVWERPLTSDDVALLYNSGTGTEPA